MFFVRLERAGGPCRSLRRIFGETNHAETRRGGLRRGRLFRERLWRVLQKGVPPRTREEEFFAETGRPHERPVARGRVLPRPAEVRPSCSGGCSACPATTFFLSYFFRLTPDGDSAICFRPEGALTQSVEYLPFKQRVARSNRARPTTVDFRALSFGRAFFRFRYFLSRFFVSAPTDCGRHPLDKEAFCRGRRRAHETGRFALSAVSRMFFGYACTG